MNGEKQCWTCVYGENMTDIRCLNKTVNSLRHKPDPYDCEFYDGISDSYMDDMEKLARET